MFAGRTRRLLAAAKELSQTNFATLRVHGPDSTGIVAATCQVLDRFGCGVVKSEQWTDMVDNRFFQRVHFSHGSTNSVDGVESALQKICQELQLKYELNWRRRRKRVAVMVSKYDHCLWELLLRHSASELDCDIVLVISNHANLKHVADTFGIPYEVIPITHETKHKQEALEIDLLRETKADVIVLARYMQVLSENFLQTFPNNIINIHHSFLPAFSGGKPYHRAHDRGVKLIGATAHYATLDLDEGPIIEQDVIRVSHRDAVRDLLRKGRILERNVLVHALEAHLDDRVIVYNNKCIVFGD